MPDRAPAQRSAAAAGAGGVCAPAPAGDHGDMADQPASDPLLTGRNETPLQRCDRNLVELLQEVRVIQTGVQVLFAFLLMAPLSARFPQLSPVLRLEYFVTILAAGGAAVLLMAPTAYHRILFRRGDPDRRVALGGRLRIAVRSGHGCAARTVAGQSSEDRGAAAPRPPPTQGAP
jgi:hypothetical protein